MDIKLSESPIAISHLLNISPESFIALSEPSQLSDHFATPFSSDLTTVSVFVILMVFALDVFNWSQTAVGKPGPVSPLLPSTRRRIKQFCHAQYRQLPKSGLRRND